MKRIFLAAEALLYAAFLALDLTVSLPALSAGLKYASILLVLLAGLTALRTRDGKIVAAALALTAAADVFLLLLDRNYMLGVSLFLLVQVLYTVRLSALTAQSTVLHLTARGMLAGFAAYFLREHFGKLELLAAAYIVWFFMNQSAAQRAECFCKHRDVGILSARAGADRAVHRLFRRDE